MLNSRIPNLEYLRNHEKFRCLGARFYVIDGIILLAFFIITWLFLLADAAFAKPESLDAIWQLYKDNSCDDAQNAIVKLKGLKAESEKSLLWEVRYGSMLLKCQAVAENILEVRRVLKHYYPKALKLNSIPLLIAFESQRLGILAIDGRIKDIKKLRKRILELAEKSNDLEQATYVNWKVGQSYTRTNYYQDGLRYFLSALEEARSLKNKRLEGNILSSIAYVYTATKEYKKSISIHLQSIEVDQRPLSRAIAHYNIGTNYLQIGDYKKTEDHLEKAMVLSQAINDRIGVGYALLSLSEVYFNSDRKNRAIESLKEAIKIFQEFGSAPNELDAIITLSNFYQQTGKLADAENLLKTYSDRLQEYTPGHASLFEIQYALSKKKSHINKALEFHEKYVEALKKQHQAEHEKRLQEMKTKFDTERTEQENETLKQANELKQLQLDKVFQEEIARGLEADKRALVTALQLGVAIFLSIIAILININRRRHLQYELTREKDLKAIEVNKKTHAYNEIEKILYPHQLAMIQKDFPIESTMPTKTGHACIICFDIQDSTQIGHDEHHEFFEAVMKDCYQIMNRNYDRMSQSADAYMIKEMGDGFLCSVGFPFKSTPNICEIAFRLATEFASAFHDAAENFLKNSDQVYCSLGIAVGDVTGYFPTIGLKQYDLYGTPIVQATRYESFRKKLFADKVIPQQSVIILQEKVARELPKSLKVDLKELEADESFRIRDDESAKRIYFYLYINNM